MSSSSKILALVLFLLISLQGISQNLVTNGGFETFTSPPTGYGQYYLATGWGNVNNITTGPPYGSPDYYHTSGTVGGAFGAITANTGGGQMGFYTYHGNLVDAREYITTQLTTPLVPGQQYQISFYLTNGTGTSGYLAGADNFGIHFSVNPLVQLIDEVIPLTPTIEIPGIIYITNTWQMYSFTFTATNAAEHLTIGNFEYDATTMLSGPDNRAYYFIDDIELITAGTLPLTVQGDSVICAGDQAILTAMNDSSYAWAISTSPSVIISNNASITVSPTITTTYLVYGTTDTVSFTVTVNAPPVVSLGVDTILCAGETLLLNAFTANATYLWQDGSSASSFNVTQPGIYSVEVTLNGCPAADTIVVSYTPLPVVDLGADTTLCDGSSITLDATTSGATYLWQDGSSASTYSTTQSGTYIVEVTVNNCTTTDSINVIFNPLPLFSLGSDTTLCDNETLLLNVATSGGTYLWQDNSTNSTFTVTQSGLYFVEVTVNNCSYSDTINVLYAPQPQVNLGNDTTICDGQTLILDATMVNATYLWHDNSTLATYNVSQSGTYYVNVTVNGCTGYDTINIVVDPVPVVSLGNDTTLCDGETLLLDATNSNAVYLWQDNSTAPVYTVSQAGTYSVQVTINNCSAQSSVNVGYVPIPVVQLGNDTVICQNDILILDATATGANYIWNDNSNLPTLQVGQPGTYWVDVTVSGCTGTDSITVEVEDCEIILELPNVFTPNGDGLNEFFVPIESKGITALSTKIFNRYGQVIHESSSLTIEWDGKNDSGNDVTDGTYYWIVNYKGIDGSENDQSGTVTVIR